MFLFSHLMLYHLRNPVLALKAQDGEIEQLVDLLRVDGIKELLPALPSSPRHAT
jgi:hypothetical protein